MTLPSVTDYHDAVQSPDRAFADAQLRMGTLATNSLGLPLMLGGGLAVTYRVSTPSKAYAVRCFHREAPGLAQRYSKISRALKVLGSSYFVEFDYQSSGVLVRGSKYPIVKMDWVEGETLDLYLKRHLKSPAKLSALRTRFTDLEAFVRQRGIAHGDLQNLNVIVQNDELRLIDYDGMFVPGMTGQEGFEVGHKAFQHPARAASDIGPNIDRFSFITIDLGLEALALDPTLFERFKHGGEAIVFSANDYADPASSPAFAAVRALPGLSDKVDWFAAICSADIGEVPTLADFRSGKNIPKAVRLNPASPSSAAIPLGYIGAYQVLDASDYEATLSLVGERVELVGKIVSVKEGMGTRGRGRGKPYIFVNFGQWNRKSVKITLWSNGLELISEKPTDAWVGSWISVSGLIEPPYEGNARGTPYFSVGITVASDGQIVRLTEKEAKFRLGSTGTSGKPGRSRPQRPRSNTDVLESISGRMSQSRSPTSGRGRSPSSLPPTPHLTSNEAILAQLKGSSSPASRGSRSSPPQSASPSTPSGSSNGWIWAVVIVGVIIAVAKCS